MTDNQEEQESNDKIGAPLVPPMGENGTSFWQEMP